MKRIAFFQDNLDVGGIQKSIMNLLRNFDYEGYQVDLYLSDRKSFWHVDFPEQLTIKYLPHIPRIYSFMPFDTAKKLVHLDFSDCEEYDLAIDFNSYQFSCALGALTVPAKRRVMWIHNNVSVKLQNEWKYRVLWSNFKDKFKYYDEFVVLLNTGMRVSEFCGLTSKDLDFNNRKINVDHQLVRERNGKYYVEKTKTQAGCRFIPMTNEVFQSLKRIIENRPKLKIEPFVDGYTGFILVDKNGNPKIALHIENEIRWSLKKYKKLFPNKPPIIVTPHVLRHTFCTNMINAGMDAKKLQYLMGHSDVSTTLNIYTHMGYEKASEQMLKIYENAN